MRIQKASIILYLPTVNPIRQLFTLQAIDKKGSIEPWGLYSTSRPMIGPLIDLQACESLFIRDSCHNSPCSGYEC